MSKIAFLVSGERMLKKIKRYIDKENINKLVIENGSKQEHCSG